MSNKATRPAFCPFIYHDGRDLFLEFDNMVLKFAFTEGGLSKALLHIPNVAPLSMPFTCGEGNIKPKNSKPKMPGIRHARAKGVVINDSEAEVLSKLLKGVKEKEKVK